MANSRKGLKNRGNGQGSAIKVGVNNWKAVAVVGYKDDGFSKPVRRTKQGFPTKAEALAYIDTLKKSAGKPKSITLKSAFDTWIAQYTASRSTIDCYRAGFKIFEDCWYLKFENLDIDELQECIEDNEKGVRTRQNAKVCLGLIYKWAIPRGYVPDNLNLSDYIKIRSQASSKSPKHAFSDDQLKKIKKGIGKVQYADFIYCSCYLGFRITEFLNLKQKDYNEGEKALTGGIKTEAGIDRTVTISPKIFPIAQSYVEICSGGYIFGDNGKRITNKAFRKSFYKCLSDLGIQEESDHTLTPHCCRHTFATLMKRVDAPDKDKLELIGHSTVEQMQYYEDVPFSDLRAITDKI